MTKSASPARAIATRVLFRVAAEGAWASPALDGEIRNRPIDPRDAALASEIVYGTLRALPSVDRAIRARLTKKNGVVEPMAMAVLRGATYQLLHLNVPPHAVVDDAVTLARVERGEGLSRFVNAVLRAVARDRPAEPAPQRALEVPAWLWAALERGLGAERARSFVEARPLPPPLTLRVTTARTERGALADRIREARPSGQVRESALTAGAIHVSRVGDPRTLPGYTEGHFAVQDEGSQLVAQLVGAQPGERLADACAGRGGKTALLAEAAGERGEVTAIDLHETKLDRIEGELERLGLPRVRTAALDLSVGCGGLEGRFDRVLVDAPCTGLGTVHRRPEILLRLGKDDPARMAELQLAIATNAAKLVRPGGLLVIATCSPTREEGPLLADAIERAVPNATRLREPVPGAPFAPDEDGVFRIGPFGPGAEDGPDAYQVVRFRMG